jgi:hypothetical protein
MKSMACRPGQLRAELCCAHGELASGVGHEEIIADADQREAHAEGQPRVTK